MSTVVVEEDDISMTSADLSDASRYSPMPTSPNTTPLLQQDDNHTGQEAQHLQPPSDGIPLRRTETMNSSEETSSLVHHAPGLEAPDPRGEAPAYFEVTEHENDQITHPPQPSVNGEDSADPASSSEFSATEEAPRRRSGFRTFWNSIGNVSNRASVAPPVPGRPSTSHTRNDSGPSVFSAESSQGHGTRTHRPSQSGSGLFRPMSRKKSTTTLNSNNLTSPSLISVNSISAPLTHTLMRTEFTYPRSGPTPEQLKLISSREAFAKFGMPYGADAIAFAASTSRHDLGPPPPDFDAAASTPNLPLTAGRSGHSRLRSESSAADLQAEDSGPPPESVENTQITRSASPPAHEIPAGETPSSDSSNYVVPLSTSTSASTSPASPTVIPTNHNTNLVPPSSFRAPPAVSVRSESRASSYSVQSFATAAEEMEPEPSTPTVSTTHLPLTSGHVLEATDTTITQH